MATDPPADAAAVCTTAQAARLLGVSSTTVQEMVERGELPAWKTPGGHRRIERAAVLAVRAARRVGAGAAPAPVTVVLADPDVDACARLVAALADGPPLSVQVAHDALEAMLMVERHRPALVVASTALAPVDGVALLGALRRRPEFDAITAVLAGDVEAATRAHGGRLPSRVLAAAGTPDAARLRAWLAGRER